MEINFERVNPKRDFEEIKDVLEEVEEGIFTFEEISNLSKESLNGEWWKLTSVHSGTIGFGWIVTDQDSEEHELSLITKKEFRNNTTIRAGRTILLKLEEVSISRGAKKVFVVVKNTNPRNIDLLRWFYDLGYEHNSYSIEDLIKFSKDLPSDYDITLSKKL